MVYLQTWLVFSEWTTTKVKAQPGGSIDSGGDQISCRGRAFELSGAYSSFEIEEQDHMEPRRGTIRGAKPWILIWIVDLHLERVLLSY